LQLLPGRNIYRMHFELVVFGEEFLDVLCECIWLLQGCKVAARRELGPLLQVVQGGSPGLGRTEELLGETRHSCGHLQGKCQEVTFARCVTSRESICTCCVQQLCCEAQSMPVFQRAEHISKPCAADNTWPCSWNACMHAGIHQSLQGHSYLPAGPNFVQDMTVQSPSDSQMLYNEEQSICSDLSKKHRQSGCAP
jgi:hypothetical protein